MKRRLLAYEPMSTVAVVKFLLALTVAFAGVGAGFACGTWTVNGDGILFTQPTAPKLKPWTGPDTVIILEWDESEGCWHDVEHPRHWPNQGISTAEQAGWPSETQR